MKISVVTVSLNSANTIERTILSVVGQDYDPIEYIVVDGRSKDRTMEIVRAYRRHIELVISEEDDGIYDAMNKGLRMATGDVVGFLNSDDEYVDRRVLGKVASRIEGGGLDAVYGDLVYVARHNRQRITRRWTAGPYRPGGFARGWVPPHPTFFCCRATYEKYGGFNRQFRVAGDFELMLRFIQCHQIRLGYIPEVLARMRAGGKANTLAGMLRGQREIRQAFRVNGLPYPLQIAVRRPLSRIPQIIRGHCAADTLAKPAEIPSKIEDAVAPVAE
ncbi:MAG: glycosyltransferase [Phycisphaerae bacterium]|nr:glycosyltransferase [Phycisphaerae bacterium]